MQQPQYYKTVRASERLPDKEDTYYVKYTTGELEVLYASGVHHEKRWKALVDEWLEPIPISDAERLRDFLEKIKAIARSGFDRDHFNAIDFFATEALSKTGDGWVRVEEWNNDGSVLITYKFGVGEAKRVDGTYYKPGTWIEFPEVTHVRPLPSPPQNI